MSQPAVAEREARPAFPLRVSDSKRYLVDAKGRPFLIHGDSPWYMVWRLTREEAIEYLDDRQAKGFTALLVDAVPYTDNYVYPQGSEPGEDHRTQTNRYGHRAFVTLGDFSTPDEGYFSHLEWLVKEAGKRGMLMLLVCADLGSAGHMWYPDYLANGVEKCHQYGRYLGSRFQHLPNVMWVLGGDCDPGDVTEHVEAMARGLEETAPDHLKTYHAGNKSSSAFFHSASWLDLNLCYDYGGAPTYTQILSDYRTSPTKPCLMGESCYEGTVWGNTVGTPQRVRRQAYWALLSGGCGHFYGSFLFQFTPGAWREWLNPPGVQDMAHLDWLFRSEEWFRLVPDDKHAVLTAGYGEFGQDDYATAAWVPDGSLVVCYLPSARTVTVDLGKLKSPVQARWFDPTRGAYSSIEGSPFTTSGSREFTPPEHNAAGDGDMVLMLQTAR